MPYDQLNQGLGALATAPPETLGLVFVESAWKASRRPYHQQKLAFLLSSQRHFALEQAARGVAIHYLIGEGSYAEQLRPVVKRLGPLEVMRPAERELREDLAPLIAEGALIERPHTGWLTSQADFERAIKGVKRWRLDRFYRGVRKRLGVLLDDAGRPQGGKWSHDADNRKPWRGDPPAPEAPRFEVDPITAEVCELVRTRYGHHPGHLVPEAICATLPDVEALWGWVLERCMPHFGPYEDAMSTRSVQLFHGRISGLLNLHRLLPSRVIDDVLALDIPLNSKEGFVRQVLGWREFVHHVHEASDGLRAGPDEDLSRDEDGSPNHLGARAALPPTYWGDAPSGFACLDRAVSEVWDHAYSHHINRLMVLSNWGTLLGLSPRALTDWFWVGFEDAYDWVVEPNVLGMGTYAAADLMVTKPYVSGSAYIDKMSDYCVDCRFSPKGTCPMPALYWQFLARHQETLSNNHRLGVMMAALKKRSTARREADARTFRVVSEHLQRGERLTPEVLR